MVLICTKKKETTSREINRRIAILRTQCLAYMHRLRKTGGLIMLHYPTEKGTKSEEVKHKTLLANMFRTGKTNLIHPLLYRIK